MLSLIFVREVGLVLLLNFCIGWFFYFYIGWVFVVFVLVDFCIFVLVDC